MPRGLLEELRAFLSTPSARRATLAAELDKLGPGISIHALREEGDRGTETGRAGRIISIHALREEGDIAEMYWGASEVISIHALREEGDSSASSPSLRGFPFLSTPSVRRATQGALQDLQEQDYFYPRPP